MISAPFLSPRGEGSRCTIGTACSESARVADSCLPQFAYANLVTISPRSFSASSTAATSNSRCSVDFTPISMLSKSTNTAILSFCSILKFPISGNRFSELAEPPCRKRRRVERLVQAPIGDHLAANFRQESSETSSGQRCDRAVALFFKRAQNRRDLTGIQV